MGAGIIFLITMVPAYLVARSLVDGYEHYDVALVTELVGLFNENSLLLAVAMATIPVLLYLGLRGGIGHYVCQRRHQ